MILDLKKRAKLKSLTSKYGFEIASIKTDVFSSLTEAEKYKSLLLRDFIDKFMESVNEYHDDTISTEDMRDVIIAIGITCGRMVFELKDELKDTDTLNNIFITEYIRSVEGDSFDE